MLLPGSASHVPFSFINKPILMHKIPPALFILLGLWTVLRAEGTRELAPNASIVIGANNTTDLAALHINNPNYNNFAAYSNPDPQSRLYIHIADPVKECVFLGFSYAHANVSAPNPPSQTFEYRIKDPNGNIVFGPRTVTAAEANILDWSEGFAGPQQLHGPGGYLAFEVTSADLVSGGWSGKGDFYIEFSNSDETPFLIDFWDISVVDCSGVIPAEKRGRIWSYNWAIFAVNDFGFPNRPFNGAFYVCAPDPDDPDASFVTRIDFNGSGFRPAAFNIAFNSFGSQNTGNVQDDRRSVENTNATRAEYAIFLNDPVEICRTAEVGEISLLGVGTCDGSTFCIKFIASKAGQVDLLLDFDGNDNVYTPGSADLMVTRVVTQDEVGQPACIEWDGRNGLGQLVAGATGSMIPVIIAYAQGIYHFPVYDAELMTNGFRVEAVRPAAPEPLLFYDDSNISVPSGSGEPSVQLGGCAAPCHRWLNYTQPSTPGFGNLHTINTWWFSQLSVRQDVFVQPAYLACAIEGPDELCAGGTAALSLDLVVQPQGSAAPDVIGYAWTGPGIAGPSDGASVTIQAAGAYQAQLTWVTSTGDVCQSLCEYSVTPIPVDTAAIDTLILAGTTVVINGESYSEQGQYLQQLTTSAGCDSVLLVNVTVINTVLLYDLDACKSFTNDGSAMDYTEFEAEYPQPLACADLAASILFRDPAALNKHSCTPGVFNTPAMCVSALDDCAYDAGNDASVEFSLAVTPGADRAVVLTGLTFYERAPLMFNWISGPSGANNPPTLFGFRVLRDGVEIYRQEALPTEEAWHEVRFNFDALEAFITLTPATYTFEFLPYCLAGNMATVAAWDLDQIQVFAACASPSILDPSISGRVVDVQGIPLEGVAVQRSGTPGFETVGTVYTAANGEYLFPRIVSGSDHYLRGYSLTGWLDGVSTLDLLAIQRHLLGKAPFDSPYQFIAADANNSRTVTAIDLLDLRKLLLGIYDALPNNLSWRYGLSSAPPDISSPWDMKEVLALPAIRKDVSDACFTGIKIGDVNGDVSSGLSGSDVNWRTAEVWGLYTTSPVCQTGDLWTVDVRVMTPALLNGLQAGLEADGYSLTGIRGGVIKVTPGQYRALPDGGLRLSWSEGEPVAVQAGDILFTLMLKPNTVMKDLPRFSLIQAGLACEAYLGDTLIVARLTLDQDIQEPARPTVAMHVSPNPARDEVYLEVALANPGEVKLSVFTSDGRPLVIETRRCTAGVSRWRFDAASWGLATGLVIMQVATPEGIAVDRVLLQR